ncbi:MAG: hypothetical protein AABZ94_08145 [Candidatus Eisenbacteria bacterium]
METHLFTWRNSLATLLVAVAACVPFALATGNPKVADQPVQVFVTKVLAGPRRVEYQYTVTNGSTFPITKLLVGDDEYYGRPRLLGEPVGWDGDTIPASSFRSPPGWRFAVLPTEEDSLIEITWTTSSPSRVIRGGESLGGFAVVLEQADSTYDVGGMWTTYMMGDSPRFGALRRAK